MSRLFHSGSSTDEVMNFLLTLLVQLRLAQTAAAPPVRTKIRLSANSGQLPVNVAETLLSCSRTGSDADFFHAS